MQGLGGAIVTPLTLTLLAESVLQKRPGAEILYDIRASRAVAAGGSSPRG